MIVSISSIVIWLLLSHGYEPRVNFIANLYYGMNIYEDKWFCMEVNSGDGSKMFTTTKEQCVDIKIQAKYLILLSFIFSVYGYLIRKQLIADPFPVIQEILRKARAE